MNSIPPPFPPPEQNPQPVSPPAYWVPAPYIPAVPASPAEPLPFHRMGRTYSAYRWWKPLMVGLIALGLYVGLMVVAGLVFVIATLANPALESSSDELMVSLESLDMRDPVIFALTLGSLVLMLPVILVATRMMNMQKVGSLTSVVGRMRWGWLGRCMLVALTVLVLSFGISFALEAGSGVPFTPDFDSPNMWLLLMLTVLLVPFQSAAEEYVFRGYLMQLVGGWLRHPAFAILLPLPLFVLGHDYDLYGQLDVGFFALAAGWLSWRTGGLEAAIALHVVNNSVIFALGAIGLVDVNSTEGNLSSLILSIITTTAFVLVVVRLANKHNIQRLSTPAPPAPPIAAPGYWAQPGPWDAPRAH